MTSGSLGLDYSYRLNDRWVIGGFYEELAGDFDLHACGLLANIHYWGWLEIWF
jgi:hypothetical protein